MMRVTHLFNVCVNVIGVHERRSYFRDLRVNAKIMIEDFTLIGDYKLSFFHFFKLKLKSKHYLASDL